CPRSAPSAFCCPGAARSVAEPAAARDGLTGMSLDPTLLFLSLVAGGIGFVLFVYGKKQDRLPQLAAGLALMIYPYFVSTVTMALVVGGAILAALWLAVRQGW